MKNLAKFALLGFVALLFSACSTTTYSAELILDTEPQQAEIICDGKSLGPSPISYNVQSGKGFFFDEKFNCILLCDILNDDKRHFIPNDICLYSFLFRWKKW